MNALPGWLLVGLGGGVGAISRWALVRALIARFGDGVMPWGTLVVNVVGCLAIGFALRSPEGAPREEWRLLLVVGLLGGFTTFSTFAHESVTLLREGARGTAFGYAALSNLLGLAAAWAGSGFGGCLSGR